MNYIMGSAGHSFVTGWGFNPPERPHHRGATCAYVSVPNAPLCDQKYWAALDSQIFPNQLFGALVGGPNLYDEWRDSHLDFVASEVALDYNAALLSGEISPPGVLFTAYHPFVASLSGQSFTTDTTCVVYVLPHQPCVGTMEAVSFDTAGSQ